MKLQFLVPAGLLLVSCFAHAGNPPLETLTDAKQVVVSYDNACALKNNGSVWCWGYDSASHNYAVPVEVVSGAISLAAGGTHTCALRNDGSVQCWGSNSFGQLGDGHIGGSSTTPVFVHGPVYTGDDHLTGALSIAVGDEHTCALLSIGRMVCWGKNNYGQLGDGTTTTQSWPVYALLPAFATGIAAGNEHSCAILSTNAMQCWGHNEHGQLGDSGPEPYSLPVYVKLAGGEVPALAKANDYDNTCVVLYSRTLKCWGLNEYGELGNSADDDGSDMPHSTPKTVLISATPIQPLYPVSDVAVGFVHACAKMDDGLGNTNIQCWGDNRWGQLGDGGNEDHSDLPVAVLAYGNASTPLTGILSIAAAGFTTCAVLNDGTVQCWGDNSSGQLGNGFSGDLSAPIFPVKQAVDDIFKNGFNN